MLIWELDSRAAHCRVAVGGDFLPAGTLQRRDAETCKRMAESIRPTFEAADVVFANLECPVDVEGIPAAPKPGIGATLGAPREVLEYLSQLKVVPVSIANNHIFDYGDEGLKHTRHALLTKGMIPLGCGNTLSDPPAVHVWESPSGIRVGFWAAARVTCEAASATRPGTEPATLQRANLALERLRNSGAHCRIALLHAGLERTNYPEPDDVALMDSFAEAGFSLVAACHSHRISGCRILRSKDSNAACFYGLGSISSGMMYTPLEREGLVVILGIDASGELIRISVNPVAMSDSGWGMVPKGEGEKLIMERFRLLSTHLEDGTYKGYFYRDISQAMFGQQLRDVAAAFRYRGVRGVLQKLGRARFRHLNRAIQVFMH